MGKLNYTTTVTLEPWSGSQKEEEALKNPIWSFKYSDIYLKVPRGTSEYAEVPQSQNFGLGTKFKPLTQNRDFFGTIFGPSWDF